MRGITPYCQESCEGMQEADKIRRGKPEYEQVPAGCAPQHLLGPESPTFFFAGMIGTFPTGLLLDSYL